MWPFHIGIPMGLSRAAGSWPSWLCQLLWWLWLCIYRGRGQPHMGVSLLVALLCVSVWAGAFCFQGGGPQIRTPNTPPLGRPRKSRGGRTPPLASRGASQLLGGLGGRARGVAVAR